MKSRQLPLNFTNWTNFDQIKSVFITGYPLSVHPCPEIRISILADTSTKTWQNDKFTHTFSSTTDFPQLKRTATNKQQVYRIPLPCRAHVFGIANFNFSGQHTWWVEKTTFVHRISPPLSRFSSPRVRSDQKVTRFRNHHHRNRIFRFQGHSHLKSWKSTFCHNIPTSDQISLTSSAFWSQCTLLPDSPCLEFQMSTKGYMPGQQVKNRLFRMKLYTLYRFWSNQARSHHNMYRFQNSRVWTPELRVNGTPSSKTWHVDSFQEHFQPFSDFRSNHVFLHKMVHRFQTIYVHESEIRV